MRIPFRALYPCMHCFVKSFLSDLELVKQAAPLGACHQCQNVQKAPWIPPPVGFMKINVDAAISKNSSKASASAVARDTSGMFVGASVVVIEGIPDPKIMEAVACRESLALASNIIGLGKGFGSYVYVIQEIKAQGESFTSVEFVHEGRMSNGMLLG
jgi:hypothetical protein